MEPYILHTFPNRFVIDLDHSSSSVCIDRVSGVITKCSPVRVDAAAHSIRIHLIIGIITLLKGRYLMVCTASKGIASIHSCDIRQLTSALIIPFHPNTATTSLNGKPLNPQQLADEQHYLDLLHISLHSSNLYFSYDYDLTLSTQRIALMKNDEQLQQQHLPLYKRADERFFWNRYLLSPLIELGTNYANWIVPLMSGYVVCETRSLEVAAPPTAAAAAAAVTGNTGGAAASSEPASSSSSSSSTAPTSAMVDFILISRRAHERTGRRFITRGLDMQGNAANFAETEQTIIVNYNYHNNQQQGQHSTQVYSYLQSRGSIPVIWQQVITLKYTPKIQLIHEGRDTEAAFRKHFEQQIRLHGKNTCLSLINQKGSEGTLMRAFQKQVDTARSPLIRLINFDFHHECRKMQYCNIAKLIDQAKDDVATFGYFSGRVISPSSSSGGVSAYNRRQEWHIITQQKGVFRTNCIDCLDRTNVVQSVLGRLTLEQQLVEAGILNPSTAARIPFAKGPGTYVLPTQLDALFRHVWANNADAMSLAYSGTGALKTDFTRTGKRTSQGALQDGVNSVTRYYLNNFSDGRTQDALDLLLGQYRPSVEVPSPFGDNNTNPAAVATKQYSLGIFMLRFTAAMLVLWLALSTFSPTAAFYKDWSFISQCMLFFVLVLVVGSRLLLQYGRKYTNKPRLRQHYQL